MLGTARGGLDEQNWNLILPPFLKKYAVIFSHKGGLAPNIIFLAGRNRASRDTWRFSFVLSKHASTARGRDSVSRGLASNAADDSILSGEREVSNWYAESCSFLAVLLLCFLRIGKRSIESERLWNVRDFRLLAGGETCVEK